MLRSNLLLFLSFTLASGLSAQQYSGKQKDIDKILAAAEAFSGFLVAGDLEGILNSYTVDGTIFPDQQPILRGRDLLAQYWRPREGYATTYHKLTPLEIRVSGKEARDYGRYEGRSTDPDGKEYSWRGKYLVIWRKVGKDWKMYLDIWNRSPAE